MGAAVDAGDRGVSAGFRQALAQLGREHGSEAVRAEIGLVGAAIALMPILWVAACVFAILEPMR